MIRPPKRFDVVVAGRRGGKTHGTGIRLLIEATSANGRLVGYMAPTYGMAKRLMWDWLRRHLPKEWIRKMNRSELTVQLVNGSQIMLFGGGNYDNARGLGFDHFEFDEVQDIPEEAWTEVVRPALSDRQGTAAFKGTPKGMGNVLFDLWTQSATTPGWGRYTFTTLEGGLVPESEVEEARSQLDERTFRQEYEASFETTGAVVYYAFDDESIVDQAFDPEAPTVMTWDFNYTDAKPMVCLLIQPSKGERGGWTVVREFVFRNSHTEETCRTVASMFETTGSRSPLQCTGDYSGNRRESNASRSDYRIISSFFGDRPGWKIRTRPTKSIRDRVAATNSLLRAADGTRRLFVDRSCKNLIEDVQRTQWKESGQGLDDDNGNRTDESDALSYFPYNWFPVDRAQKAKVTRR